MVDFEWYRSFLAVYRVGTVTGAALELGLTQPAVTQHIAALEAAVQTSLFTRTPRRMAPTERGKALYTQIAQALETLEQVSRNLRRPPADLPPLLRLGTPREYFAGVALERLVPTSLRIQVQFGATRALLEALRRDELDLVIATERITAREVEYRKLEEEHFVLVGAPQAAPPAVQPETDAQRNALEAWLLQQRWVVYGPDLPIVRRFWRQSFNRRPEIEPALIIPDLLLIAQIITHGGGVSVLPFYLCEQALADGHLQLFWNPPQPVTNTLWLAYRTRDRQSPVIAQAVTALMVTS
jgi:DNA-binding transcriptional LysR family regulator